MEAAAVVWIALFGFQAVGTILYLALVRRLLVHLETNHAATWRQLGEPSLFLNNTLRNNLLLLRYLWDKEYLSLPDAGSIQQASRVRTLLLVLLTTFGILIIGFVVLGASFSHSTVV
jgi:hypothetical protein